MKKRTEPHKPIQCSDISRYIYQRHLETSSFGIIDVADSNMGSYNQQVNRSNFKATTPLYTYYIKLTARKLIHKKHVNVIIKQQNLNRKQYDAPWVVRLPAAGAARPRAIVCDWQPLGFCREESVEFCVICCFICNKMCMM